MLPSLAMIGEARRDIAKSNLNLLQRVQTFV